MFGRKVMTLRELRRVGDFNTHLRFLFTTKAASPFPRSLQSNHQTELKIFPFLFIPISSLCTLPERLALPPWPLHREKAPDPQLTARRPFPST